MMKSRIKANLAINGAVEKIWTSTPYQNSDLNAARLPFRHDRN